ncbi:hypothetical protein H6P81_011872 [Aristolochia fimbriata]|uniref:Glucosidase II beta subunit N-terminal domain-containing protein n=1 Tax=Aristolochia fimbriata TaxID=158543 RepID=A0AAV7EAK7_ARIFI|nr:hypothetical protein H6P81_011872 [Aristolochia fimbriata]
MNYVFLDLKTKRRSDGAWESSNRIPILSGGPAFARQKGMIGIWTLARKRHPELKYSSSLDLRREGATEALIMERGSRFMSHASLLFLVASLPSSFPAVPLLGVSPQDEKYYRSSVIACKDGSKTFSRDRLNDGFCDCVDGTDEPGTSACPESKFYCRNAGSMPQMLFSSCVNDHICDCCDGSDENDGSINCPNTCSSKSVIDDGYNSMKFYGDNTNLLQAKRNSWNDLILKLKELKIIVTMEVFLLVCIIIFGLFRRQARYKRRRPH